jgi:hypothetical protein
VRGRSGGGLEMKRCEYCGYEISGDFAVGYEETKGNCTIIKKEPTREINGKLRKVFFHKGCAGK